MTAPPATAKKRPGPHPPIIIDWPDIPTVAVDRIGDHPMTTLWFLCSQPITRPYLCGLTGKPPAKPRKPPSPEAAKRYKLSSIRRQVKDCHRHKMYRLRRAQCPQATPPATPETTP